MDKPQNYKETCKVVRNLPYQAEEGSYAGGGVINRGRIVWIQQRLGEKASEPLIRAFADGIGLISLDRRFLVRAE
jgi:hypothetical protein